MLCADEDGLAEQWRNGTEEMILVMKSFSKHFIIWMVLASAEIRNRIFREEGFCTVYVVYIQRERERGESGARILWIFVYQRLKVLSLSFCEGRFD